LSFIHFVKLKGLLMLILIFYFKSNETKSSKDVA
jgi:hypothetical protein